MTLADYLVIAVSPALVMAMVGSLVFFLVEVFYQGQYEGRLRFVLAMFVVAAVLIGRISIELGTERATLYAMPLAMATASAINRFVVSQSGHLGSLGLVGNLALLGLIWWAAHKLAWDCTFIDESRDYSGEGLLQAAGLQKAAPGTPAAAEEEAADMPPDLELPEHADPQRAADRRTPWWSRVHRRPPRTRPPGVWIVYFALVALPIFGLGQALIPAEDAARRTYGFWLLLTYAASALGLLLLTSFLGLRRYLRQRWLTMPARMAVAWVATGTMLILAVLTAALLLPRPAAEFSWDALAARVSQSSLKASRWALGTEGTDDPRPDRARVTAQHSRDSPAPAQDQSQEAKPVPQAEAASDHPDAHTGAKSGQRQAAASAVDGHMPSGRTISQGRDQPQQAYQQHQAAPQGAPEGRAAEKSAAPTSSLVSKKIRSGPDAPQRFPQRKPAGQHGVVTASSSQPDAGSRPAEARPQHSASERQDGSAAPASAAPPSQAIGRAWAELVGGLIGLLKWVFYGAVVVAVAFWVVRHGREIVAEIGRLLAELRAWWSGLFARRAGNLSGPAAAGPAGPAVNLSSLADYADPFLSGAAERMSPDALVRYSFEALEAWGRGHGCPRDADHTPTEFAQAVGRLEPTLAGAARDLAKLYCRAAYAGGCLSPSDVEPLRDFWQRLRWSDAPSVDSSRQPSLA